MTSSESVSAGLNVVSARGKVPLGAVAEGTGRILKLSPLLAVSVEEGMCVGGVFSFASAARAAEKSPVAVVESTDPRTGLSSEALTCSIESSFSTTGVSGKVPGIGAVSPSDLDVSSVVGPEETNPTTAAPAAAATAVTGAATPIILSVREVCVSASSVASVTGPLVSLISPVPSVLLSLGSLVSCVVAGAFFSIADVVVVGSASTTGSFSRSSIVSTLFSFPSWSSSVGE